MIDHVLGRPSIQFRKVQVLAVVAFWSFYLFKGNKHGPPYIRKLSQRLSKYLTTWQTILVTMLYLYTARNFSSLLGLEAPEPLANLYTRSYFRATWFTTALDAGFWTAMRIRRKWLRDFCSIVFSVYYLFAAERADEKVRKVRGVITLDHLRVSWNKSTTPYLAFASAMLRPRLMKYPPRQIRIPRPANSDYKEPVHGWLYFDGPLSSLKNHSKVVLDIPGGGYVAMTPRNHDDKLIGWAGKTGLPMLSLDYKKAPEHPYPYALNECYDVYRTIVASRGQCLGFSGEAAPKIVITGDSAGGGLAAATIIMIIESGSTETRKFQGEASLPVPDGLMLMYPGLDMNIGNWMTNEQMSLIEDRRSRKMNKAMLRQKSQQYSHLTGTPHPSDDELENTPPVVASPQPIMDSAITSEPVPEYASAAAPIEAPPQKESQEEKQPGSPSKARRQSHHSAPLQTRLAMTSMISYFNDRILTPEMMRAMIILYIGPHNRPDFSLDYLLSPILAPDTVLAHFPKTYFLTGERDPLVDDTVIFAGRLRRAKAALWQQRQTEAPELGKEFDDRDVVEVTLIPKISHGFLQFLGVYPEGWKHLYRSARWIQDLFDRAVEKEINGGVTPGGPLTPFFTSDEKHHFRRRTESSGDEAPLEIGMSKIKKSPQKEREKAESMRKRKERLLKEHLEMKQRERSVSDGRALERGRGRGRPKREKSMVSLASEDDLLGRRMLSLAGPLTGTGDDGR